MAIRADVGVEINANPTTKETDSNVHWTSLIIAHSQHDQPGLQQTESQEDLSSSLHQPEEQSFESPQDDTLSEVDERELQQCGNLSKYLSKLPIEFKKLDEPGIREAYRDFDDVNILFFGQLHSGKSALGNALLGLNEADGFEEGDRSNMRCTTQVQPKSLTTQAKLKVRVWDAPGLKDASNRDEKYYDEMDNVFKNFGPNDLLIYCLKAEKKFFTEGHNDLTIMKNLNKKLGRNIWERTVFVITFANTIVTNHLGTGPDQHKEIFKKIMRQYQDSIFNILKNDLNVKEAIARNVPVVPAGHISGEPHLPGHDYWFSYLWFTCLSTIPTVESRRTFLNLNRDRFTDPASASSEMLQRGKIVLTDDFIPKELIDARRKGRVIGGLIGLLGGPLGFITVPLGIWAGGRREEKRYKRKFPRQEN